MKMGSNKALQVTAHKAAPNLNADVRKENERCGTGQNKGSTATRKQLGT